MATKKFKIYHRDDFEKLLNEFVDSRKLSETEQAELDGLKKQYYTQNEELAEVSLNLESLIHDLRLELARELTSFENKLDLLKKYVRITALNEKLANSALSDEEMNERSTLLIDLKGKEEEIKTIISTFKSVANLEASIDEVKRLKNIENDEEFIKAIEEFVDNSETLNQYLSQKTEKEARESEIKSIKTRTSKIEQKTEINVDNLKTFLEEQGFSSEDAEKLFRYSSDSNFSMSKKEYKQRKENNKRDQVIKKGLIPTAVTCGGIGAVVLAIKNSGLNAITSFGEIFPVMGSEIATIGANATLGAVAGLIATPVVFWAKSKLTKLHYKLWYKNAKTNLKDYEAGTAIEDLHITKLMEKIEKTTHTVLAFNQGNWFTRKFKFIPKHILNAINRNRVHHLEAYTQDLCKIYQTKDKKNQNTNNVEQLLNSVKEFIDKTTFEIQLNTMLYRQDKSHKRNPLFELIDIYETLLLKTNAVSEGQNFKKLPRKTLDSKKAVGSEILNHGFNISLLNKTRERDAERKAETINNTTPNTSTDVVVTPDNTETPVVETKPKKTSNNSNIAKINERETTRRVALEKLNDSRFVDELIAEGFKKKDIRTLKTRLEEAIDDNKGTVVKSTSNAFQVYLAVIEKINKEKAEMAKPDIVVDTSDDVVETSDIETVAI